MIRNILKIGHCAAISLLVLLISSVYGLTRRLSVIRLIGLSTHTHLVVTLLLVVQILALMLLIWIS